MSFSLSSDALASCGSSPVIAAGVSGGADSMALCLLLQAWTQERHGRLVALTVDHGLRAESAQEAQQVAEWCAGHAIEHHTLPWEGEKPAANLQAAAREARYRLMAAWCRKHGIRHLAVAHTQDDQAETLIQRLWRGSGVYGLAGMPRERMLECGAVRVLRPLLDVSREALRHYLHERGQAWIDDPSNVCADFQRIRARRWLAAWAGEGADAARLAHTAAHLARAREVIERDATRLLKAAVRLYPEGYARYAASLFAEEPEEIRLRALSALLCCVGGNAMPPRFASLHPLDEALHRKDAPPAPATLHGCRLLPVHSASGAWEVLVCREWQRAAPPVDVQTASPTRWDGRFTCSWRPGATPLRDMTLGVLGEEGWAAVRCAASGEAIPSISSLPYPVRFSLPALRRGGELIAVPHANLYIGQSIPPNALMMDFTSASPLYPEFFIR